MNADNVIYKYNKIFFEKIASEPSLSAKNYAIAGGAIRDAFLGERVKDIDIFCQTMDSANQLSSWFLRQNGVKVLNCNKVLHNYILDGHWFQIIMDKEFDLDGTALIESFDFTICGAMISNNELKTLPTFYQDLVSKHLRLNSVSYPLSSLERLQKYIKKGYTACNGTLLELARAINNMDLSNPEDDSLTFYPDGSVRFIGVD